MVEKVQNTRERLYSKQGWSKPAKVRQCCVVQEPGPPMSLCR